MKNKIYAIWSNEHKMWWRPNRMGYTDDFRFAGKYYEQEAKEICHQSNCWIKEDVRPDEVIIWVE